MSQNPSELSACGQCHVSARSALLTPLPLPAPCLNREEIEPAVSVLPLETFLALCVAGALKQRIKDAKEIQAITNQWLQGAGDNVSHGCTQMPKW